MEITFDTLTDWKSGHASKGVMDDIVDYLKENPGSTVDVKLGDEILKKLYLKAGQVIEGGLIADSNKLVVGNSIYTLPESSS